MAAAALIYGPQPLAPPTAASAPAKSRSAPEMRARMAHLLSVVVAGGVAAGVAAWPHASCQWATLLTETQWQGKLEESRRD